MVASITLWLALAPASADAAVGLVAAESAQNAAGATTLVVTKPSGVVEGNVMIATVAAKETGAVTAPSGWTAILNLTQATALRQVTYYKVATASEPASYSWSLGTSRAASGGIAAYSGVNATVPVDATASATGASGNAAVPSATTSAPNDLVLAVASFAAPRPSRPTRARPSASTSPRAPTRPRLRTSPRQARARPGPKPPPRWFRPAPGSRRRWHYATPRRRRSRSRPRRRRASRPTSTAAIRRKPSPPR